MRVLQQVTGITEYGQRVNRQVSVATAETLPTLSLVDGDDLTVTQTQRDRLSLVNTESKGGVGGAGGHLLPYCASPPSYKMQGH